MAEKTVRTRIAPSPTGDPHVGTGYIGLVNMVVARQAGGQFLLRIDDTDRTRYRPGSEEVIFESLRWLGLDWDEGPDKGGPKGPYRQSERNEIYREHAERLLANGKAYRCFCTGEELDALRKEARANKRNLLATPWRDADPAEVQAKLDAGAEHVVRFKTPNSGETVVQDLLRGAITFDNAELDDKVLLKADGFPTYHLASVVDDALMEITHIIRAEEWVSSAPLHQLLFAALDFDMPVICHMPLLRNADKSKISKRKNPVSLLYYRDAGYLPQGLLNFLALLGWGGPKGDDGEAQEQFTVEDMLTHFKLDKVSLGEPVFDLQKLDHINGLHVRSLSLDAYVAAIQAYAHDADYLRKVAVLMQPRTERLGAFVPKADFFFGDVDHVHPEDRKKKGDRRPVPGLVPKNVEPQEAWFVLGDVAVALDGVDDWTPEALEARCRALATEEETGWKVRDLFMAIRVAVSGKAETPGLFETMEVLGKARCLGRLGDARRVLPEPSKKAIERRAKQKRPKA